MEVSALERHETPKGVYLAHRVHQRGKATVDVLADVMGGMLRDMTFPKQMRWDAYLEDGKGALVFARPIRWLVLMYGGRVVPFVIRRPEMAQGPTVQDIRSGSNTYGHRFLTTSGRAGRAIKIKTFDDYKARLLENFVILERSERESRIRRELETHARKLGARVSPLVTSQSSLLAEVPDLVEYPSVVAGHFPVEFLQLPEEVLTTTMIHHQHYFPVVGDDGKLKPAFLAVTNMQPEKPEIIARNSERVLTARLRDARFFWDEDRIVAARVADRPAVDDPVPQEAGQLPREGRSRGGAGGDGSPATRCSSRAPWPTPSRPDGCARPISPPTWCASSPSCRARWAASTPARTACPRRCGRRSTTTTCRWAWRPTRRRPQGSSGAAAVTWAAVSLADKLDSVVGMFAAGERPTGLARSARAAAAGAGAVQDPGRPAAS